jgi:hypothetical protein
VRTQKGGHDAYGLLGRKPTVRPEQLELGIQVKTVAALALDGRDAECEHLFQKTGGSQGELLLGRCPGMAHGRSDPAAASGNVEITASEDSLLELVGSPAAEREMCVTVDQAGDDQSPACIEPFHAAKLPGQLCFRTDPSDSALVPDQRGIGNGVDVTLPALRAARGKLRDVSQHLHAVWRSNNFTTKARSTKVTKKSRVAELSRSSVSRRHAPSPSEWQDRNPHPRGA